MGYHIKLNLLCVRRSTKQDLRSKLVTLEVRVKSTLSNSFRGFSLGVERNDSGTVEMNDMSCEVVSVFLLSLIVLAANSFNNLASFLALSLTLMLNAPSSFILIANGCLKTKKGQIKDYKAYVSKKHD